MFSLLSKFALSDNTISFNPDTKPDSTTAINFPISGKGGVYFANYASNDLLLRARVMKKAGANPTETFYFKKSENLSIPIIFFKNYVGDVQSSNGNGTITFAGAIIPEDCYSHTYITSKTKTVTDFKNGQFNCIIATAPLTSEITVAPTNFDTTNDQLTAYFGGADSQQCVSTTCTRTSAVGVLIVLKPSNETRNRQVFVSISTTSSYNSSYLVSPETWVNLNDYALKISSGGFSTGGIVGVVIAVVVLIVGVIIFCVCCKGKLGGSKSEKVGNEEDGIADKVADFIKSKT